MQSRIEKIYVLVLASIFGFANSGLAKPVKVNFTVAYVHPEKHVAVPKEFTLTIDSSVSTIRDVKRAVKKETNIPIYAQQVTVTEIQSGNARTMSLKTLLCTEGMKNESKIIQQIIKKKSVLMIAPLISPYYMQQIPIALRIGDSFKFVNMPVIIKSGNPITPTMIRTSTGEITPPKVILQYDTWASFAKRVKTALKEDIEGGEDVLEKWDGKTFYIATSGSNDFGKKTGMVKGDKQLIVGSEINSAFERLSLQAFKDVNQDTLDSDKAAFHKAYKKFIIANLPEERQRLKELNEMIEKAEQERAGAEEAREEVPERGPALQRARGFYGREEEPRAEEAEEEEPEQEEELQRAEETELNPQQD